MIWDGGEYAASRHSSSPLGWEGCRLNHTVMDGEVHPTSKDLYISQMILVNTELLTLSRSSSSEATGFYWHEVIQDLDLEKMVT